MSDSAQQSVKAPRWPFLMAVLFTGFLMSVLSEKLTLGPSWSVLAVVVVLIVPMIIALFRGHHRWTRIWAFTITWIMTLGLVSSVVFLISSLFAHTASAASLFRDACVLWCANTAVFSVWYWEVDQGGPICRLSMNRENLDFLFPQYTLDSSQRKGWKPGFLDYLFLAFNTNTAFSPTDTMVLSKRAKLLLMMQASISLVIVVVLAARAINIA